MNVLFSLTADLQQPIAVCYVPKSDIKSILVNNIHDASLYTFLTISN